MLVMVSQALESSVVLELKRTWRFKKITRLHIRKDVILHITKKDYILQKELETFFQSISKEDKSSDISSRKFHSNT